MIILEDAKSLLLIVLIVTILQATPIFSFSISPSVSHEMNALKSTDESVDSATTQLFRIRTVTAFISISPNDLDVVDVLKNKIQKCSELLNEMERSLIGKGYELQTKRIATNPFDEWLTDTDISMDKVKHHLQLLDSILETYGIEFCSLGPAQTVFSSQFCGTIVSSSHRFSCSADVSAANTEEANAAAENILAISQLADGKHLEGGLGNFRFCAACCCKAFIPFFPGSKGKAGCELGFALGLENGALANKLLSESKTIAQISTVFKSGMVEALMPLQNICEEVSGRISDSTYLGIDSSLNPSLDDGGSVAEAIEIIDEVGGSFGGRGSLACAAEITKALQSLPGLKLTGYCGLMLPVCEDRRLSELASKNPSELTITQLLNISSVCGVGVDTVPIPGDTTKEELASLILDVAGLADRWGKSLSCRVFPYPNRSSGEETLFDSPYMCNCKVFSV